MDGGGAAVPNAAISTSPGLDVAVAPAERSRVENCYGFKSWLQEYTHKLDIPTPEYHTLEEGPSHERVFKSTVFVNETRYESLPGFFSRKAAEQSAAEVALMEIAMSAPVTEKRSEEPVKSGCRKAAEQLAAEVALMEITMPAPVTEKRSEKPVKSGSRKKTEERSVLAVQGLCKNILREYAQKMNYAIPSYICIKQDSAVAPFICSVEIGGIRYTGAEARTKKLAEIRAARTALLAIQGQSEGGANVAKKYLVVPGQRPNKETDKKPIETPKPLKVKKRGLIRKWNKRKFMRMAS